MIKDLRIALIFGFFAFLSLILTARLFWLQVLKHSEYEDIAWKQHSASRVVPARRGNIYSSDNYPLALTDTKYLLFANPNEIKDASSVAHKLAPILETDAEKVADEEQDIKPKLSSGLYWVVLARDLDNSVRDAIQSLGIAGLGVEEVYSRYYPEGYMASHVLGYVRSDEVGNPKGYFGVEGYYDGDLRGIAGNVFQEKDAYGLPISIGQYEKIPPKNGRSLVLTLDRTVQFIVESKLKEGVDKYRAKSGTILVVEPQTGKVLALANYPDFDPANPFPDVSDGEESKDETRNLAVASVYEPGSVVKALTMSAAVDLGKITPESTYMDDGPKVFSGHTVDNWNGKHHGLETMISILQHSNNLGAAYVGHLVGAGDLSKYFERFGFGSKTGIDLEGEDTGIVHDPSTWTDIDLATAAFGQGVSATPLQVTMAFSAIANDGILMKPMLVSGIVNDSGSVVSKFTPQEVRRVISHKSADILVDMLTQAVSGGEEKFFVSKKYLVAGKTGTAQIPENGKYDLNKTNATFVGFLPKSRKFVMLVKLEEPEASIYAAETSVPMWMDIAENIAAYYRIPPDK